MSRPALAPADDSRHGLPSAVCDAGQMEGVESLPAIADIETRPVGSRPSSEEENIGVQDIPPTATARRLQSTDIPSGNPNSRRLGQKTGTAIPEDDGMHELRSRIHAINSQHISTTEKARLMHAVLLEGYLASQVTESDGQPCSNLDAQACQSWKPPATPGPLDSLKLLLSNQPGDSTSEKFVLNAGDAEPTYAPLRLSRSSDDTSPTQTPSMSPLELKPPLGCQHYERNVKLQCFTCKKWYTCRFCHDAKEDHVLIRKETRNMLCMLCATPQKASDVCANCGQAAAQYYCNICKLWENRKTKPIYHCHDCGICRRGLGLGKDFFHCKTCRACITTSIQSSHKCIERSTDCDCPICGEYMFTSPKPVVFMACGHSIHKRCYDQHLKVSYKCPICNKSLANMESQFRNLDAAIQSQPMPPGFQDTRATILCNDCSGRSTVPYHWLGLKCSICLSYNTVELQIHGEDESGLGATRALQLTGDATLPPAQIATQESDTAAVPRANRRAASRRRHSSHGVESQHRLLDRATRSLSPSSLGPDLHLSRVTTDFYSDEDDLLGFWRGNSEDDCSSDEGGIEGDLTDTDDLQDYEEDEDEDEEEDEIVLIGHR